MKNSKLHGDTISIRNCQHLCSVSFVIICTLCILKVLHKDYVIQGLGTIRPRTQQLRYRISRLLIITSGIVCPILTAYPHYCINFNEYILYSIQSVLSGFFNINVMLYVTKIHYKCLVFFFFQTCKSHWEIFALNKIMVLWFRDNKQLSKQEFYMVFFCSIC